MKNIIKNKNLSLRSRTLLLRNQIIRTFAALVVFPITVSSLSPSTLDITKLNVKTKTEDEVVAEKIVHVALDTKNPQILTISEKQISVKIAESNADKEIRIASEQSPKIALRDTVTRERKRIAPIDPDHATKRALVKRAAAQYGIPWQILEAVWQVETGKSWDTGKRSYAGAQGPMQFLPSTFRHYSNGDINSANDSVHAAAKLLAASGASQGNIDRALYAYNHSSAYVAKVKGIAASIAE